MLVNHAGAIGDTILAEPALHAWSVKHSEPVDLFVAPKVRELFRDHPTIRMTDDDSGRRLSAEDSLQFAARNQLPFAGGYFPQLGMRPAGRLHFRVHDFAGAPRNDFVVIAPFSVSCHGNKCPPLEWWQPIIKASPWPVFVLAGEGDPRIPCTTSLHGLPLRTSVELLASCHTFISVDTGLLHMAGVCRHVVFLSSAIPWYVCAPAAERVTVVQADHPTRYGQADVIAAMKN